MGDVLCGGCYFVLWGPKGKSRSSATVEAKRPQKRRDERGRPIWIPGPTGL